jgi:molybdenum cofactor cytidylyltransferase
MSLAGGAVVLDRVGAALGCGDRELVAVVGGGGKTTLLFAMARQLAGSVVVTTTTKMHAGQTGGYASLIAPSADELSAALDSQRVVVAWAGVVGGKAAGIDPALADEWFDRTEHLLVEADGSRMRPFKAPAPHEPVIPSRSTLVLSVMGADALGRVIEDQCHRPLRVAALAGCSSYERLTPERAARVLSHPDGGAKGVPPSARHVVVVTKVDAVNADLVDELRVALGAVPIVAVARIDESRERDDVSGGSDPLGTSLGARNSPARPRPRARGGGAPLPGVARPG